jgi:PAS domain-containing protein
MTTWQRAKPGFSLSACRSVKANSIADSYGLGARIRLGRVRIRKTAMAPHINPTGRETFFPASDLIVSKTDLKGRITYANRLFCRMAGYREAELINQPHSIIRHPDAAQRVQAAVGYHRGPP